MPSVSAIDTYFRVFQHHSMPPAHEEARQAPCSTTMGAQAKQAVPESKKAGAVDLPTFFLLTDPLAGL
jgi:hypothetical protein